ncbi:hypothetical protein D3C81_1226740 [compost metagenome]
MHHASRYRQRCGNHRIPGLSCRAQNARIPHRIGDAAGPAERQRGAVAAPVDRDARQIIPVTVLHVGHPGHFLLAVRNGLRFIRFQGLKRGAARIGNVIDRHRLLAVVDPHADDRGLRGRRHKRRLSDAIKIGHAGLAQLENDAVIVRTPVHHRVTDRVVVLIRDQRLPRDGIDPRYQPCRLARHQRRHFFRGGIRYVNHYRRGFLRAVKGGNSSQRPTVCRGYRDARLAIGIRRLIVR